MYTDDPSIRDEDELLRRVPLLPSQVIWDGNAGDWRPSSAAFNDHPNRSPMSVHIAPVLDELGLSRTHPLTGYESTNALVSFPAGVARMLGQGIAREPLPGDPAHGVVFGDKSKAVKRGLAKSAVWVVRPPWPDRG